MTNYAYIRVSTASQNPKSQEYGILKYCNKTDLDNVQISVDICPGGVQPAKRKLGKLIDGMESGDHLIVTEISRLGRSLRDVILTLERVKDKGGTVHVIKQALVLAENGNAVGKLVVAMYSIFAEMERELMVQRVNEGIRNAQARGVVFGRPRGESKNLKLDDQADKILELMPLNLTNAKLARLFKVSPTTMKLWMKRKIDNQGQLIENAETLTDNEG